MLELNFIPLHNLPLFTILRCHLAGGCSINFEQNSKGFDMEKFSKIP